MGIDAALGDLILAFPGLSALVENRVYFYQSPQSPTYPMIVFFQVNEDPVYSLTGANGLTRERFQIDTYAEKAIEAKEIGRQLKLCLSGFRGVQSDVNIQSILLLMAGDMYDETPEISRVSQDYAVWFQQEE